MVVDLPAPLGPNRPKNSPSGIARSIPRTAGISPSIDMKVLLSPTGWTTHTVTSDISQLRHRPARDDGPRDRPPPTAADPARVPARVLGRRPRRPRQPRRCSAFGSAHGVAALGRRPATRRATRPTNQANPTKPRPEGGPVPLPGGRRTDSGRSGGASPHCGEIPASLFLDPCLDRLPADPRSEENPSAQ